MTIFIMINNYSHLQQQKEGNQKSSQIKYNYRAIVVDDARM